MGCDKYIEWLSAALDGELTAEERRELDNHLVGCPDCAALFETLSAQSRTLRELKADFPADLHGRIMKQLPPQESPSKKNKVIHWKRWGSLAACLVLVAAAVLCVPRGQPASEETLAPAMQVPAANEMPTGYYGAGEAKGTTAESYFDTITQQETNCVVSMSYSKVQYLRVGYGHTPEAPSAVIIADAASLSSYLAGYGTNRFDENMNPIPIPELEALRATYTDEFFSDRCLLMILVEESSGSIAHEFLSIANGVVTVRRIVPEMGTCDMAAWLLVVELDERLDDGSTLSVKFTN